ncbi:uncharacterized protein LOC103095074 isoform X2 [Monodelphis domestica]|uniref:uncharacterized protein LOC103095074 isoform X2 n=1 Tax=Monodelphis domestica TaxID=13616 RepID=UPI0024E27065|nr:uncharacterized protein LOC103095074 isoform X2 [Monodelphis domestica]
MAGDGPGQLKKDQIKSVMTKKTSSGQLLLESSEQTSFQKDHLTYKCLWKKEEFVVLKNGRELEFEMRTSTYKNKKLLFQNIILKMPLSQGKQANNGVRKAVLAQRCLGSKKVSSALTKTRVLALARKGKSIKKQNNPKTELQKQLENAQNQKIGVSTEIPLQFATADFDLLARRWWWPKGAFLKASPNLFTSRNNQENQGNRENNPKPLKTYALHPLEATKAVQQSIRTWKLYKLNVVSKEPCKSVNSKRALGVDEEEPKKDEIMLTILCRKLLSLNISANGSSTWKVQSRKIFFGHYAKIGRKGLLILLTSMKTRSMVIRKTQRVGNRVILSVTKCVHISNGRSREPCRKQNSTDLGDISQILSRNGGQEAKSSTSEIIQEKLKFLSAFKATSKDKECRIKIWSVYVRLPLKLHEQNANTFQRKTDRLVYQDGSQGDPRILNRKPDVVPRAPYLDNEGKTSQWIRLEESRGKNSWNRAQLPFIGLLCSQLYTFIIRSHSNIIVMSQRKLTAFIKTLMAQLPGKSQPAFAKLTGMLTVLKVTLSPKSSFHLESQEANSMFPNVLSEDLRLRSKKSIEPDKHNVTVTNHYRKLLHDSDHLPSDLLYFPGFAPSRELNKRQKREAKGGAEMVAVPVGFLNRLASLLGFGVGIVTVAFIFLSVVLCILFYKWRETFKICRDSQIETKSHKSSITLEPNVHGISLSRCFHTSGIQFSGDKEFKLQPVLQDRGELSFVVTSITSETSSSCENTDISPTSLSSSDSFASKSIEASGEWFSDEEGFLYSSSLKGLMDRVKVYLETIGDDQNPEKFQCDVIISENQNQLHLDKKDQKEMQMPNLVPNLFEASLNIPHPPESAPQNSKVSFDFQGPPKTWDGPSQLSSGFSCQSKSCFNAKKASSGLSYPPESRANASEASSDHLHLP